MKRRRFLKGLGVVSVVVVGGGVWRAFDQGVFSTGKGDAYEPWENWREESEGPLSLVRAAILAANPHNTQPWLFAISDSAIELFADQKRNLGTMDVYLREMHIGLGCAVENMLLAADASGYDYDLELVQRSLTENNQSDSPALVAKISLLGQKEKTGSALYDAIPFRHTDRAPYEKTQVIADPALQQIQALGEGSNDLRIFLFSTADKRGSVTEGCISATQAIIDDRAMSGDSATWFRHDWDDVQDLKDGPHIDTAGVSPLLRAVVKILPPVSEDMANEAWMNSTKIGCESSPVLGFIAVRSLYDCSQTLRAGRLWQRMHLWAASQGISMQPVNQMCEIVDRQRELGIPPDMANFMNVITGEPEWRPTFVFRMGYSTKAPLKSARRPVEEVLV